MATRKQVVDHARKYVGTPFQHQARVLGRGMDCVGLVLCVGDELELNDINGRPFKRHEYPDYNAQPDGTFVQDECRRRLLEKPLNTLKNGDIVTMKIPVEPCHAGIIADRNGSLYLIHAYGGGEEKVIEHILDKQWRRRIIAAFSFPGLED